MGLVSLLKHEAAERFFLHLSAAKCKAVAPACNPYSVGKSSNTTLALDPASGSMGIGQGEKPPY